MGLHETLGEIRGTLVVALKEGAQLGIVQHIFVDTTAKKISAISFRSSALKKDQWVPIQKVESVGDDVVFVTSKTDVASGKPQGRSVRELQGLPVTTLDGDRVGALVDLGVNEKTWMIRDLFLAEGKLGPAKADQVTIGKDAILVSPALAKTLQKPAKDQPGFLGQVFGADSIEGLSTALRRAIKGSDNAKPKALEAGKNGKPTGAKKPAQPAKKAATPEKKKTTSKKRGSPKQS